MKIYQDSEYSVTKIEFCCHNMSAAVLMRDIVALPWTDHVPRFCYDGSTIGKTLMLRHCPFCGAEIEGVVWK